MNVRKDYIAVWYRKKGEKELELIPKDEFKALRERFKPLIGDDFKDVYAIFMVEHEKYKGFKKDQVEIIYYNEGNYNEGNYKEVFEDAFQDVIVMRVYRDREKNSYVWRYHQGDRWVKPEQHISDIYLFEKNGINPRDVHELSYPYNYVFFDKDQVIHQTNVEGEKNKLKKDHSMTLFLSLKVNIADFDDAFYTPKSKRSRKSKKSKKAKIG